MFEEKSQWQCLTIRCLHWSMINDGRGTDPVHRSSTAKTKEPQEATRTDVERTKSAAFAYFCAKSMREAVERFSIYCFRLISAQFCTT